jgi:hypothetical protein
MCHDAPDGSTPGLAQAVACTRPRCMHGVGCLQTSENRHSILTIVKDQGLEQASWPTMSDTVQTRYDAIRSTIYQDSFPLTGEHSRHQLYWENNHIIMSCSA